MKSTKWIRSAAAAVSVAGLCAIGSVANATEAGESAKVTRIDVPFEHGTTLAEAVRTTEVSDRPVLAYRFENDEVVGEYAPQSSSPGEFLADFRAQFMTEPRIVGVVVAASESDSIAVASRLSSTPLEAHGEEFTPAPVPANSPAAQKFVEPRERALKAAGDSYQPDASREGSLMSVQSSTRWDPDQADIMVFRSDADTVYFQQYYAWVSLETSPNRVPDHFGLEFEVNVYNPTLDPQAGTRPFCLPGYKEQPFAINYNWTWYVFVGSPAGMVPGWASTLGAYADYNDVTDPCARNSIAIGFANPRAIPIWQGSTVYDIMIAIQAPRGVQNAGQIGGVIQPVTTYGCEQSPNLSLTDCMGLVGVTWPGPGPDSRTTLNEARNWTAPPKCWTSYGYGGVAPSVYTC